MAIAGHRMVYVIYLKNAARRAAAAEPSEMSGLAEQRRLATRSCRNRTNIRLFHYLTSLPKKIPKNVRIICFCCRERQALRYAWLQAFFSKGGVEIRHLLHHVCFNVAGVAARALRKRTAVV